MGKFLKKPVEIEMTCLSLGSKWRFSRVDYFPVAENLVRQETVKENKNG